MEIDTREMNELLELSRENNKMLHALRRSQRMSSIFTVLYWAIILGSIFGVYYYFQPTIQKYTKTIKSSFDLLQSIEGQAGAIPTNVQILKNLLGK